MPDAHREDIAKLESLYAEHPEGRIFTHLAEAYRKAGELERAADVVRAGLERHPDYSSAHVVLGRVLVDQGRPDEAEAEFTRVLELDPHNLVALRALGDLARAAGRRDAALAHYQRLLEVEPADDQVGEMVEQLTDPAFEPSESTAAGPSAGGPQAPTGEEDHAAEDLREGNGEGEPGEPIEPGEPGEPIEPGEPGEPVEPAFQEPVWLMPEARPPERAEGDGGDVKEPAPSPPTALPGVMTETIAQVYARQGLYDRAAEVYRELLRGRPGDDRLRERLEEMERMTTPLAGLEPGERVEPSPAERAASPDWSEPLDLEPTDRSDAGEGTEPAPSEWREPMDLEATDRSGLSAASEADAPPEAGSAWVSDEWGGREDDAEPTPYAWAESEPEPEPDDSAPIRSYLQSLLAWSPRGGPAGSRADQEESEHEGSELIEDTDAPDGPVAESPEPASPESARPGEPGDAGEPAEPGEPGERVEPGDAGEPGEEDDDLETFRSWLENLKQ